MITLKQYEKPWQPAMDVQESNDSFQIHAELPGFTKKDILVEVISDRYLEISGERPKEVPKGYTWVAAERSYGDFKRKFDLIPGTNPNLVTAKLSKGVLEVMVPKPLAFKDAKMVKIEVQEEE